MTSERLDASTKALIGGRPRVPVPLVLGGLMLAYLPSYLPSLLRLGGFALDWGPPSVLVWNWLAVVLLALYIGKAERLGTASIRLTRPGEKDLEWAGYFGGGALAWHWLAAQFLPISMGEPSGGGGDALIALGPLLALALVITASVTEEVLWRGYVVERLAPWIGPIVAAAVGLVIFAWGHIGFFGTGWLITGLPGSIGFYVLLLWRKNLWACIVMHVIVDVPVFIMSLVALAS